MPIRCSRSACFVAALLAAWCALLVASNAPAAPPDDAAQRDPFTLADGDRVVLLGSTFIERAQTYGYLETALASRFHDRNIHFRNLGWSGDNVFGLARAGFGDQAHGFEELEKQVAEASPTVILLNYGANESFAGKAGLPTFLEGLDALLATLDESGARIVFVVPPPQEDLGRPLPDPTEHNRDLKLYRDAILKVAATRQSPVVDLYNLLGDKLRPPAGEPLTDNGLHLTAYGYWRAAPVIEQALELPERKWLVEIDAPRGNIAASGTRVRHASFSPEAIRFAARDGQLPLPPAPEAAPPESRLVEPRVLRVYDLPRGTYELQVDAQPVASASSVDWARGMTIDAGPEFAQAERLRQLVREKNELYFNRWRPQNVTYLFGFRKHEQGNNAVEIPQFDPLVAERESSIRQLAAPVEHEYQLRRVGEAP